MLYDSVAITVYILVLAAMLGLVMGSFINCWAWRYLNGESVAKGRSHCTSCGHELSLRDLVPVISWFASRGSCRYCAAPVSTRYPATEAISALAYLAIVASFGISLETMELLAFASILLFLSLTDLDDCIIPNGCIAAAIAVRAAFIALTGLWSKDHAAQLAAESLIGGIALGGAILLITLVADKLLGRPSMGYGDVKLFAVAGLYFGWQQGIFLVILSCIVGLTATALLPAHKGAQGAALSDKDRESADCQASANTDENAATSSGEFLKRALPFGPSIAAACVITMLAGGPFVSWYQSLLGL